MSAESDYVQHFMHMKYLFDTDPMYSEQSTHLPGRMDIGIEMTVVESNLAQAYFQPDGHFFANISPGQKSYIRAPSSSLLHSFGALKSGPSGITIPTEILSGLHYPRMTQGPAGDRWYAYAPSTSNGSSGTILNNTNDNWIFVTPFTNHEATTVRTIDISLVPFRDAFADFTTLPNLPDGGVYIRLTRPDGHIVALDEVTFDATTHQLRAYGARMDSGDYSSLWVISFYISIRPPE